MRGDRGTCRTGKTGLSGRRGDGRSRSEEEVHRRGDTQRYLTYFVSLSEKRYTETLYTVGETETRRTTPYTDVGETSHRLSGPNESPPKY